MQADEYSSFLLFLSEMKFFCEIRHFVHFNRFCCLFSVTGYIERSDLSVFTKICCFQLKLLIRYYSIVCRFFSASLLCLEYIIAMHDLDNFTVLSNSSNCYGREDQLTAKYSLEAIVVISILTSLFCLFAFAGNVTVIMAIIRDRIISKHKQHLYLLSLAVADALLVVLVVPFSLTNELLGYWPFGYVYCRIYLSLDILFCTASICNICCIGIDRYVSVRYPTKYKKLRRMPRIRGAIIFVSMVFLFFCPKSFVFLSFFLFNHANRMQGRI